MTPEDELHWLALRMVSGLGARRAMQLLTHFRTPQGIFRASKSDLQAAGLSASSAQSIASGCSFEEAVTQQERLRATGSTLIPVYDPRYPAPLKQIFDPPIALYAKGKVELLQTVMLGVVGTRRPTPYGTQVAERLSTDLCQAGITISSGMARGIDTAAHSAVLDASGLTVAVFGSGLDHIYPSENRRLAERMFQHGLIISEYPLGTPGYPQNFPVRNRIIAGMSVGVLVVEGAQYSGSAITARLALDQGRDVFAVPGNITSKASWGPNLLIKQGAKLVQEAQDVLDELNSDTRRHISAQRSLFGDAAGPESTAEPDPFQGPMAELYRLLLKTLPCDAAMSLDDLMDVVEGWSSSEIIAGLFELEMTGQIRQLAGRRFVRVWKQ